MIFTHDNTYPTKAYDPQSIGQHVSYDAGVRRAGWVECMKPWRMPVCGLNKQPKDLLFFHAG
jgi:hypothetical protein